MEANYPGPSQGPEPKTVEVGASLGPDFYPDHTAPLKARDQWLCSQNRFNGKSKKPRKVPVDPTNPGGRGIDKTDPNNWMSHDEAKKHYEDNPLIDHYGFATCERDLYSFVDIDERIDAETGEVPPLVDRLVQLLDSYAYVTPNHGVRIVVEGELNDTGGNYVWTDPDTGEEYTFEVYDRRSYLVFTDMVFHDELIGKAQEFLDALKKKRSSTSVSRKTRVFDLPEVRLPKDLEEARQKVKHLFMKHDLDPSPILEGDRKITLISYFRTIVRNDHLEITDEADELWKLINCANQTMLFDKNGEQLEGLEENELSEVYETVLKDLPDKAPKEVQEKLDGLCHFLMAIKVRINYQKDSQWKVVKALEEHGRKYGSLLSRDEVRVNIGQIAHAKQARIGSPKTLEKALRKLERLNIVRRGWDKGDKTRHFVINLNKAMDSTSWEIEKEVLYAQGNKSDVGGHHFCIPAHKELIDQIPEEVLEALVHATWYRNVGPTKIRYVLAILIIDLVFGEKATSTKIAGVVGIQPSSVSRPLRELREAGVIYQDKVRGPYRVDANVAEDLYEFRSVTGEFDRDEIAKRKARDQRRFYAYQLKLQATILRFLEDGLNPNRALERAEGSVTTPKGMDDYEFYKRREWAFAWALTNARTKSLHKD